ncbi:hypothetical protein AX774_g441 [Zancudomyces culisetae]|uniref:MSP domain-containing protein n=1 Tax=Zancudomyces culisetae TaxID=1213189 RepID=A0A1R1PYG6_ZANCU|nr:hypothetical protein AX774_g441 [Zancudomyces culisetae]|eukprot:OMH85977.1 hypothetical protein AX774_g441 [Zancudomyces culisetae]
MMIGLQPRNDVQDDFKCKDKFLIQSFQIDENQSTADLAALWTSIEHEKKDQIKEKKLRVSYEPESANDESVSTSALKKTTEPANTTRAQPVLAEKSTPPSKPSEPITPPPTTPLTDVPLSALEAKESNNIEKKSEILDQIAQEQPKKAENKLDLAGQLKEKDQKIAELTKLLNENGLLGGNLDSSDKTPLNNLGLLNTKEVDGISLPTAIFLAFVAFFIGWLFF